MTYSIAEVLNSIAGVLITQYPDYPVYTDANQQGTLYPCFFVLLMPSTISAEPGGRYYRDLGIDIIFVQERNVTDGNTQIQDVQEYLDMTMETFPYMDSSGESGFLHSYEREATTEDQELHYKLHLKARVYIPNDDPEMEVMEENNVAVK